MDLIEHGNGFDREKIYNTVNPNQTPWITFSELVSSFSDQYVEKDDTQINLLQYIFSLPDNL